VEYRRSCEFQQTIVTQRLDRREVAVGNPRRALELADVVSSMAQPALRSFAFPLDLADKIQAFLDDEILGQPNMPAIGIV
jgi:hypothetical protein